MIVTTYAFSSVTNVAIQTWEGYMTGTRKIQKLVIGLALAMMLIAAVPTSSLGKDKHGRRWRNRDNRDDSSWSRRNRKCRKFKNCHDARDGRWDGRGPRGDRVGNNVWRDRNRRSRWDNDRWDWRDRNYDSLRRVRRNR